MEMTREAELREDAERGRRAQIAIEELCKFLDYRREKIVMAIEDGIYHDGETEMSEALAELRAMAKFRRKCKYLIQRGELAEEELTKNGE